VKQLEMNAVALDAAALKKEDEAAKEKRLFNAQLKAEILQCIAIERDPGCKTSAMKKIAWQETWTTEFATAAAGAKPAATPSPCHDLEMLDNEEYAAPSSKVQAAAKALEDKMKANKASGPAGSGVSKQHKVGKLPLEEEILKTLLPTPAERSNKEVTSKIKAAVKHCEGAVDAYCEGFLVKYFCKAGDAACEARVKPYCDVKQLEMNAVALDAAALKKEDEAAKEKRLFNAQLKAEILQCIAIERDPGCKTSAMKKIAWQETWTTEFATAAAGAKPAATPSPCHDLEMLDNEEYAAPSSKVQAAAKALEDKMKANKASGPAGAGVSKQHKVGKLPLEEEILKTLLPTPAERSNKEVTSKIKAAVEHCEGAVDAYCEGFLVKYFCKAGDAACEARVKPYCDVKQLEMNAVALDAAALKKEDEAAKEKRLFNAQLKAEILQCIAIERDPGCKTSAMKKIAWQETWTTEFATAAAGAKPAASPSPCHDLEMLDESVRDSDGETYEWAQEEEDNLEEDESEGMEEEEEMEDYDDEGNHVEEDDIDEDRR